MAGCLLKIRNELDGLPAAAAAATQFLEREKASASIIFAANLAIEEIVTNTIKYGYDDALPREITVKLTLSETAAEIEICDDAREFDPFGQPEPDLSHGPREAGGLGIYLVRSMLDTCEYERRDGRNVVRLIKKL